MRGSERRRPDRQQRGPPPRVPRSFLPRRRACSVPAGTFSFRSATARGRRGSRSVRRVTRVTTSRPIHSIRRDRATIPPIRGARTAPSRISSSTTSVASARAIPSRGRGLGHVRVLRPVQLGWRDVDRAIRPASVGRDARRRFRRPRARRHRARCVREPAPPRVTAPLAARAATRWPAPRRRARNSRR